MKRLTAKFVESVTEPGKYHDGDAGLYLYVQERKGRIRRSYIQRLTIHGKRVDLGLGSAKWTTPSEARATAQANRKIARTGGDPRTGRHSTVPTFEEAADAVIRMHAETWRDGGKTANQWQASLRDYAMPRLGRRPVNTITSADVLAVLMPIWNVKRETARRVRQRIGAICKWAIAEGHRDDNPAGDAITSALPRNGNHRQHFKALPYSDRVGDARRDRVRASPGHGGRPKRLSSTWSLTAARSGEVHRMAHGGRRSTWTRKSGRYRANA